MAKKKDMVRVGYPMYKCRLCGQSFTEPYTSIGALHQAVENPHGTEAWRCPLHLVDFCKDGNLGVADFQGLVAVRPAIPATEDMYGDYLDPTSKEPIPAYLLERE